ncbi:copper chaperone PCu(A)C [uncultured Sulfitobacter sp.]|uniref:copper chaperone PCu(A)C n=1 Tax=uncultured Sulfitobacter sp. TaxID=191468 RepID=UPI0026097AE4|nr:copper chaperone PCu(A)C [uncultured Sulfitobacter sp.]
MNIFTKSALAVLLSAGIAQAGNYTLGDLKIEHPRAFETAKNAKVGGGYMTLTNNGGVDDTLVEVRVAEIPRIELHLSETDANGVATMTEQKGGIPVPAGKTVMLMPGGLHVMFMGLGGDPFELGEQINATLVFEQAGEIDIAFDVVARTAGDHGTMKHGDHGTMDNSGETNSD